MPDKTTNTTDSNRQSDSGNDVLITPSQAKARGIPWEHEPPKSQKCQFCGAELEPTGILFGGKVFLWQPEHLQIRCNCKQAQAYWDDYDKEQERLKAEKEEMERRQRYAKKIRSLLSDSGMKKRFRQRTFKNFICKTEKERQCYVTAKDYADNFEQYKKQGRGLYFEGTNGTGKTHLAAAIALQLISQETPVICRTGDDLLADVKRAYDKKELSEHEILDAYKNVDLLIIDDLGKEQCTDWSMTILYSILNARYEDMKPVIVTTNYNTDDLTRAMVPKGMDDTKITAIVSRLREVSTVITMAWEDRRKS